MNSIRYRYLKEGKIYNLKCAFAIKKLLKKYHYMYLVIEKNAEPDRWDVFFGWELYENGFSRG